MKHLAKYMHDVTCQVTEIWCDAERWSRDVAEDIESSTCIKCLRAAAEYGKEAHDRKVDLQAAHIRDMLAKQP